MRDVIATVVMTNVMWFHTSAQTIEHRRRRTTVKPNGLIHVVSANALWIIQSVWYLWAKGFVFKYARPIRSRSPFVWVAASCDSRPQWRRDDEQSKAGLSGFHPAISGGRLWFLCVDPQRTDEEPTGTFSSICWQRSTLYCLIQNEKVSMFNSTAC